MLEIVYIAQWLDTWYDTWEDDETFDTKEELDTYFETMREYGKDLTRYRKLKTTKEIID